MRLADYTDWNFGLVQEQPPDNPFSFAPPTSGGQYIGGVWYSDAELASYDSPDVETTYTGSTTGQPVSTDVFGSAQNWLGGLLGFGQSIYNQIATADVQSKIAASQAAGTQAAYDQANKLSDQQFQLEMAKLNAAIAAQARVGQAGVIAAPTTIPPSMIYGGLALLAVVLFMSKR